VIIDIKFVYDENDKASGAKFRYDVDARVPLLKPSTSVVAGTKSTPLPGGQYGMFDVLSVSIDPKALKDLTQDQLTALAKSAAGQNIESIRVALIQAVWKEQERRDHEQKK
jgi:hypothetical protein